MALDKRPGPRSEDEEQRRVRSDPPDPAQERTFGASPAGRPASEESWGFRGGPAKGDHGCAMCGVEFQETDRLEAHRAERHAGGGV